MKRNLGMPIILSALVLTLAACGTDKMAANDSGSNAATGQNSSNTAGTSGATYSESASRSGTTTPNATLSGNTAGTIHGSGAAVVGDSQSSAPLARQLGEDNRHGKKSDDRSSFDAAERDKSVDSVSMKTRYQLMLDNARVHDTDGFLFDGENASHDTL